MKKIITILMLLPIFCEAQIDTGKNITISGTDSYNSSAVTISLDSASKALLLQAKNIVNENNKNNLINPYILADSIYSRQRMNFQIACNYRQYDHYMDKSMMFGLVATMMAPCILAYSNSINHKDGMGQVFYGAYSGIAVTAGVMCVVNLIKGNRIKNRKFKNR